MFQLVQITVLTIPGTVFFKRVFTQIVKNDSTQTILTIGRSKYFL